MKGWGGLVLPMGLGLAVNTGGFVETSSLWVLVSAEGQTGGQLWVGMKVLGQERTRRRVSVERESRAESVSQVSTG